MSVADLHSKVRLLDQRAAKANLWSMGLWAIGVVVLLCGAGLAAWSSLREPMDLVSVQIPPAIQVELSAEASPARAAYPPGSLGGLVAKDPSEILGILRVLAILSLMVGMGVGLVTQRLGPLVSGLVFLVVVLALDSANHTGGVRSAREDIQRIVVGIEARDYEDVRAAMMERSKRFPEAQEDYLWWQLAALSNQLKGVDFGSILASVETKAAELQPTPGVRYALEKRALGSPRSEEAKAFEMDALEALRPWNGVAKGMLLLGVFTVVMASAVTVFARVLNRRVTRIATMGISV